MSDTENTSRPWAMSVNGPEVLLDVPGHGTAVFRWNTGGNTGVQSLADRSQPEKGILTGGLGARLSGILFLEPCDGYLALSPHFYGAMNRAATGTSLTHKEVTALASVLIPVAEAYQAAHPEVITLGRKRQLQERVEESRRMLEAAAEQHREAVLALADFDASKEQS
jgi:hypothetical protein